MERWLKIIVSGKDPDGLSAIETDTYFHRFCEKMEDLFHLPDDNDDDWSSVDPSDPRADPRTRRLTPVDSSGSGKSTPRASKAPTATQGDSTVNAVALMKGDEDDSDEGL